MDVHTPGTFCWADLAAPDMDAATGFYTGLFGWTAEVAQPDVYSFFLLDGRRVCGYGPPGPGEPPSWRGYVAVEDAEATAEKVKSAGGQVVLDQMDVFGQGRMLVFTDLGGAVCCAWEPKEHPGADVIREPGALGWFELAARDIETARRFYSQVFGWSVLVLAGGYAIWSLKGTDVGGLLTLDQHPSGTPPHWSVQFMVDDVDGAASKAHDLGGGVVVPPTTIEVPTRGDLTYAVLRDPNQAAFGVFQMSR